MSGSPVRTPPVDATPTSRRRLVAFRWVASVLGLLTLGLSVPFAVISLFASASADVVHRVHNASAGAGYGLLGALLLVCAWRPEWVNAFQAIVAIAVLSLVGGLVSGDLITGFYFTTPLGAVVLYLLHPRREEVFHWVRVDVPMTLLVAIGFVPAVLYALSMAELQRNAPAGDPHAELHHWSAMAVAALSIVAGGEEATVRSTGRRVTAWLTGIAAVVLGASWIAYPDYPGAEGAVWGLLVVAWGVGLILLGEWSRARGRNRA